MPSLYVFSYLVNQPPPNNQVWRVTVDAARPAETPVSSEPSPEKDVAVMTPVATMPSALVVTIPAIIDDDAVATPVTARVVDVVTPDTTNPPSNCPYPAEVNVPPAPALPSCKPLLAVIIPVESILVTSS
jgi:hypothetical protein